MKIPPLPDEIQALVDTELGKFRWQLAELTNGDMTINDAADIIMTAVYLMLDGTVMPPTAYWLVDFNRAIQRARND